MKQFNYNEYLKNNPLLKEDWQNPANVKKFEVPFHIVMKDDEEQVFDKNGERVYWSYFHQYPEEMQRLSRAYAQNKSESNESVDEAIQQEEYEIDGYKVYFGEKPSGDPGIIVQDAEGNKLSGWEEDNIPKDTLVKIRAAKDKIGRKNKI